jgi:hypothetical protein
MHGLSKIIQGRESLSMKITSVPVSREAATLNEKMLHAYGDDGSLKVKVTNNPATPP